jgi:hypothetical protein
MLPVQAAPALQVLEFPDWPGADRIAFSIVWTWEEQRSRTWCGANSP